MSARLGDWAKRGAGFVACCAAALLFASPPARAQDGRRLTAPADVRVQLDLQHFYLPRDLQVTLSALDTAYPEFLRLESLGRSASGSELWVMTIARKEGLELARRPGVLIVAGLGLEDLAATELALHTIAELVQNHARDESVQALLERAVVYVVPCANPDLRERVLGAIERGEPAVAQAEESVLLDRNFPQRWDPLALERCGPFPLSRPESRALAEFVLGRPNLAVVQRYSASQARSGVDLGWPAADVRVLRRVASEGLLESVETAAAREGSLLSFAYEQAGAFAFAVPALARTSGEGLLPGVDEILPLARNASAASLRLMAALPRLELLAEAPSALDPATWQVELELRNLGRLPSASELAVQRYSAGAPTLEARGAELVGAALLRASDGAALVTSLRGGVATLPQVGGGETLRLRAFLTAAPGAQVTLSVRAPRAGEASVQTRLP